jgi:5-methylcytosine-specific restriction endonuclease McrA
MASKNHTCVLCGNQLPEGSHGKKKYCSYKCGRVAQAKIYHASQPECTCLVCEKVYRPKSPERNKCCSRECGFVFSAFKRSARATGARVWVRVRVKKKTDPKPYVSQVPESLNCKECKVAFSPKPTGGRPAEYCSVFCRNKKMKKQKRITKSKRDAITRKAFGAERIDPIDVFERDNWRCCICGIKTPKRKRGTYDNCAPELDHIVSLANGGSHTWGNVQCCCRECNIRKGAKNYGQLILFPYHVS